MRLIKNIVLVVFMLSNYSCTTHQKVTESLLESERILKERTDGAKKIANNRANVNPHKIMDIVIPKPSEESLAKIKKPVPKKKELDIFEVTPKGMLKGGLNE